MSDNLKSAISYWENSLVRTALCSIRPPVEFIVFFSLKRHLPEINRYTINCDPTFATILSNDFSFPSTFMWNKWGKIDTIFVFIDDGIGSAEMMMNSKSHRLQSKPNETHAENYFSKSEMSADQNIHREKKKILYNNNSAKPMNDERRNLTSFIFSHPMKLCNFWFNKHSHKEICLVFIFQSWMNECKKKKNGHKLWSKRAGTRTDFNENNLTQWIKTKWRTKSKMVWPEEQNHRLILFVDVIFRFVSSFYSKFDACDFISPIYLLQHRFIVVGCFLWLLELKRGARLCCVRGVCCFFLRSCFIYLVSFYDVH